MITVGLFRGGPELHGAAISKAWRRIATAVSEYQGKGWLGKISGLNVGLYVDGSAGPYNDVPDFAPVRFSRKKKLLLVNVRVPEGVVDDFEKAFHFIIDSLHRANAGSTDTI